VKEEVEDPDRVIGGDMKILLVEPSYYTAYPPMALLKLATYHKRRRDEVQLVRGCEPRVFDAKRIYVTSLFTYAWQPVKDAVWYYRALLPKAKLVLGGIYASLMPKHAVKHCDPDKLVEGLAKYLEDDDLLPDYSLVAANWRDTSIVFASRGCIRKCRYCAVPKMEGPLKGRKSIRGLIWPGHRKVIFWDNNFLAMSNWSDILAETRNLKLRVDFNQGLDARLITAMVAEQLKLSMVDPVRLAYDRQGQRRAVLRAISHLTDAGFNGRRILVYTLYNFDDDPDDFWKRVCDLMEAGVAVYPMRYQKLDGLVKNHHVSSGWTRETLDMVAHAQRVIGYGGAFPPYEGLVKKLTQARDFYQAFELRPEKSK
jgi:hypothetical protein